MQVASKRDAVVLGLLVASFLASTAVRAAPDDKQRCANGDASACCRMLDGPNQAVVGAPKLENPNAWTMRFVVDTTSLVPKVKKTMQGSGNDPDVQTVAIDVATMPAAPVLLVLTNERNEGTKAHAGVARTTASAEGNVRFVTTAKTATRARAYARTGCKAAKQYGVAMRIVTPGKISLYSPDEKAKRRAAKLARGAELYKSASCIACHSLDGSARMGPTFKKLYGAHVDLVDGRRLVANGAYLRRAIKDPGKDVRKGYPPAMPASSLSDADINALVTFIHSHK